MLHAWGEFVHDHMRADPEGNRILSERPRVTARGNAAWLHGDDGNAWWGGFLVHDDGARTCMLILGEDSHILRGGAVRHDEGTCPEHCGDFER